MAKTVAKGGGGKRGARGLKVYRTAIGFHDAYVAAPSKKAALAAWGTDKDLFARGAAEQVDDPALSAEALAAPGTVIRRIRGSLAEQLDAVGDAPQASPDAGPNHAAKPVKPRKPKPKPSRANLDAAEAALAAGEGKAEADRDAMRREEDVMRQRHATRDEEHHAALVTLAEAIDRTKAAYEAALQKWRADS